MSQPMQLSWWRFGYLMSILAIGPVLITLLAGSLTGGAVRTWLLETTWLLYVWVIVFFALGWRSLRRENAVQPLFHTDIDRARSILYRRPHFGKFWLSVTLVLILALTTGSALYGAAA